MDVYLVSFLNQLSYGPTPIAIFFTGALIAVIPDLWSLAHAVSRVGSCAMISLYSGLLFLAFGRFWGCLAFVLSSALLLLIFTWVGALIIVTG